MSSISGRVHNQRILTGALVAPVRAADLDRPSMPQFTQVLALVDTGAVSTYVSREIVDRFSLMPTGRRRVLTINDDRWHSEYVVQLGFETNMDRSGNTLAGFHALADEIIVADIPANRGFDVLVGMDVIQTFDLHVWRSGAFRIDFGAP